MYLLPYTYLLECCGHLQAPGSNDGGIEDKLLLQQRAWLCCGDVHSLVAKVRNTKHLTACH